MLYVRRESVLFSLLITTELLTLAGPNCYAEFLFGLGLLAGRLVFLLSIGVKVSVT